MGSNLSKLASVQSRRCPTSASAKNDVAFAGIHVIILAGEHTVTQKRAGFSMRAALSSLSVVAVMGMVADPLSGAGEPARRRAWLPHGGG